MVSRPDGDVMAFERSDTPGAWQLPQGGIERGESPESAAWRELGEETGLGVADVRLVGEHPDWTIYEWPSAMRSSQRLGQAHRWFFFERVDGGGDPTPDGSEFSAWRWMSPADLIASVVGFRQGPYRQVLDG